MAAPRKKQQQSRHVCQAKYLYVTEEIIFVELRGRKHARATSINTLAPFIRSVFGVSVL